MKHTPAIIATAIVLTCLLSGGLSIPALFFGLLLGEIIVLFQQIIPRNCGFARGLLKFVRFSGDFFWDLTKSNVLLAWEILTPRDHYHVQMIKVPVHDLTELETAVLSHRITLTPGTLSCGVSYGGDYLLVHVMYGHGAEDAISLRKPIDILKGLR